MPVNITNEELDIFNKNGFTDDDVKATVENYRSQGLDDNAIRSKIDARLNSWNAPQDAETPQSESPVIQGRVEQWGLPQYQDTLNNNSLTPQQKADEIAKIGQKERDTLDVENALDQSRAWQGLGLSLVSGGLTKAPIVAGALLGKGEADVEGNNALDTLLKMGEYATLSKGLDLGAKGLSKGLGYVAQTPFGQKVGKEFGRIGEKILSNPKVKKVTDFLSKEINRPEEIAQPVEEKAINNWQTLKNEAENGVVEAEPVATGEQAQRSLENTVLNAKGTPKEVKNIIKNDMPQYSVMHNNELTEQAVQNVEKNFENEYSRLATSNKFEALDFEEARQIAKRLFDNGEHQRAIDLIDRVSEEATKKGQAIQALSLWSNMTPEGAVYKAEKLINQYNKKTGKAIKLTPEQIDNIRKLQTDALTAVDDYQKSVGIAKTAQYVAGLIPKGIGQKLKAYRNLSLLLNPKTLGRNIIGNALFNITDTASKAVAVPIDRAMGLFTGQKTRVLPQIGASLKGGLEGTKKGFSEALQGIDTRGLGQRFDLQSNRTFNNPIGNAFETALDVGLRVPDRTFYEGAFAESVANMMKAQGLKEPTQAILEQAEKEALEAVFQNESKVADTALALRKGFNNIGVENFGLGDALIPYAQTPANLVQQGINYSPLGAIKSVGNLVQGNQRQASLDLARALLGTGIGVGGYELAKNGLATPTQFDENYTTNRNIKNNLATLGIRPDQIGDYWYSPFQPMSIPLASGIATQQGEQPLQAGLNTITSLPFLDSYNKLMKDWQEKSPTEALINFAGSVPSQFVPTLLSQTSSLFDDNQRETYSPNKLMQGVNQALLKTPARVTLPVKYDVKGQAMPTSNYEGLQRVADTYLNPTYVNRKTDDVVMSELKALYDTTNETKQLLPTANKKVNFKDENGKKQNIILDGKQLSEYQKALGEKTYEEFDYVMGSDEYKNADDDRKVELLQKHKSAVKQLVDNEMFGKPIANAYKNKVRNLYINQE